MYQKYLEVETPINNFKTTISNYQAEFTISQKEKDEFISLKLVSEIDDSIREGKYTLKDLPQKIIEFYQGFPILRTLFQQIHQSLGEDALKINEEGDLVFIKRIELSKSKISQKKFILSTKQKEMTDKDIMLNMQREIKDLKNKITEIINIHNEKTKQLQKQIFSLKNKAENDEIFSKVFSKIQFLEDKINFMQNPSYKFSLILKATNIKVNDKVAERIVDGGHANVIVENSKGRQFQKISFKIKKLVYWMSFGVGLLDSLQNGNFGGNYGNKVSYSLRSDKHVNLLNKPQMAHNLNFTTNDIIEVILTKETITFTKEAVWKIQSL